jgi:hypothetical protein
MKSFPLKSGMRQRYSLSPFLLNIVLEFRVRAIRWEKEIKGIQTGKEEVKLSLFADYMIFTPQRPKKLSNLINTFREIAEYKINMQKSVAFRCWEKWICACRKLKVDPYLLSFTSINSK